VERLARGWHLAKIALGVVRSDGSPLAISILGGLAAMLAALAFGIPAIVLFDRENDVLAAILAVLGGYAATFLAVYFGVALAAAAASDLSGAVRKRRAGFA
jgi:hypothetical protein